MNVEKWTITNAKWEHTESGVTMGGYAWNVLECLRELFADDPQCAAYWFEMIYFDLGRETTIRLLSGEFNEKAESSDGVVTSVTFEIPVADAAVTD